MTIYASDQIHMSIPKAADILGLGRAQVRVVDSDDRFRMNVPLLRETLTNDLRNGMKPFCVVASGGTVNYRRRRSTRKKSRQSQRNSICGSTSMALMEHSLRSMRRSVHSSAESTWRIPFPWIHTNGSTCRLTSGCLLFRDEARARAAFSFRGRRLH
jgi:hypothetical protein